MTLHIEENSIAIVFIIIRESPALIRPRNSACTRACLLLPTSLSKSKRFFFSFQIFYRIHCQNVLSFQMKILANFCSIRISPHSRMASQERQVDPYWVIAVKDIVGGSVGGACRIPPGHPFDTVKVRMQTTNQDRNMARLSFGSCSLHLPHSA